MISVVLLDNITFSVLLDVKDSFQLPSDASLRTNPHPYFPRQLSDPLVLLCFGMSISRALKSFCKCIILWAVQYLDPLSAQLVQPSFTHLIAGLGMLGTSTEADDIVCKCFRTSWRGRNVRV